MGSSDWLKVIGEDFRKECTYVQLKCDDKFLCGFEFITSTIEFFAKDMIKLMERL